MKNTFVGLLEQDADFRAFMKDFSNSANYYTAVVETQCSSRLDLLNLVIAYAFKAGKESRKPFWKFWR